MLFIRYFINIDPLSFQKFIIAIFPSVLTTVQVYLIIIKPIIYTPHHLATPKNPYKVRIFPLYYF